MIFTIGYQGKKDAEELVALLKKSQIELLLDVRSKPYGRRYMFNRKILEATLPIHGIEYRWAGERLGGFAVIEESAIASLAQEQEGRRVCLMCMEEDPDQCHRKTEISRRLAGYGVTAIHL